MQFFIQVNNTNLKVNHIHKEIIEPFRCVLRLRICGLFLYDHAGSRRDFGCLISGVLVSQVPVIGPSLVFSKAFLVLKSQRFLLTIFCDEAFVDLISTGGSFPPRVLLFACNFFVL